ncbi:hypothetical protein Tco_0699040 [Tanacetum coccineum]
MEPLSSQRDRSLMLDDGKQKGMPIWNDNLLGHVCGAGPKVHRKHYNRATFPDLERNKLLMAHSSTLEINEIDLRNDTTSDAKIESIVLNQ